MRIKDESIIVQGIRPELIIAMIVANDVYRLNGKEFVLTSVNDGSHSLTSLHYSGCAFDCRIYNDGKDEQRRDDIKSRLGVDFDVILEGNHMHIEFQPKKR